MDVQITREGTSTLIKLSGRLDTTNVNQFQEDIKSLMEDETPNFEFDCTDMEYTSSQGLRMFLMLQKSVNAHKGIMVMKNMKPQVKEVFDITGFSSIINIQ
ncbi:MAG: STAS domain-containing protein [Prevotella sp.]|nr:STAS domain-containing protein [Candidatus Equicola faecalis]